MLADGAEVGLGPLLELITPPQQQQQQQQQAAARQQVAPD
jgi:hypothetical protein